MTCVEPRFECLIEKAGTWMVRDNDRNCFAVLAGTVLRGRQKQRAEAACSILTRIYGCQLDARSVRANITGRPH